MKRSLDSMVILVDTREQDTPSLRRRLELMNCPWERQKLDFGDYSAKCRLPDGEWLDLSPKVAVERKMSFDELCACFCRGRQRFTREFERAREAGAAVYLLIENASWENALAGEKFLCHKRSFQRARAPFSAALPKADLKIPQQNEPKIVYRKYDGMARPVPLSAHIL